MKEDATPQGPTLALLATRIADELGHLGTLSEQVQAALSQCGLCLVNDRDTLRGLQGIDRISQGLTDLARLMEALGAQICADLPLPPTSLAGKVTLRELSLRLFQEGEALPAAVPPPLHAGAGNVHLF